MVKVKRVKSSSEKHAITLACLVEEPEACEGKSNADVEKEIIAEYDRIPL